MDTFWNKPELILLYTIKWFQVFLSNTNISIYNLSFVCRELNGYKYCSVSLTIQLNSNFLHTIMIKQPYFKKFNLAKINKFKWLQVLFRITNNSIEQ